MDGDEYDQNVNASREEKSFRYRPAALEARLHPAHSLLRSANKHRLS